MTEASFLAGDDSRLRKARVEAPSAPASALQKLPAHGQALDVRPRWYATSPLGAAKRGEGR